MKISKITDIMKFFTSFPLLLRLTGLPQGGKQRGPAQPNAPLAPGPQQATKPDLQKPVDLLEGPAGIAKAEAGCPLLMKTGSKSCPLAPRGLAASTLLRANPAPSQARQAGYGDHAAP